MCLFGIKENGITFKKGKESIAVKKNGNKGKVVIVPKTVNGLPVKVILENAFAGSKMEKLVLPDGLYRINKNAFANCKNLTTVIFPEAVRDMGGIGFDSESKPENPFEGCTKLKEIFFKGADDEIGGHVNIALRNYTVYYYSATKPYFRGNHWHFDANGNPVKW